MTDESRVPLACTLTGASYRDRLAWIGTLNRDGLERFCLEDLTLELHYSLAVAPRVHELVRRESECCAFLRFEIDARDEALRLTVTAPARARGIAGQLFQPFLTSAAELP